MRLTKYRFGWFLYVLIGLVIVTAIIIFGKTERPLGVEGPEKHDTPGSKLAPVFNEDSPNRIPDQYIVDFKPGTNREAFAAAQSTVKNLGGTIRHIITSEPMWFSAKMPAEAVKAMRATPGVAYIEADQRGTGSTVQPLPEPPLPPTDPDPTINGLDRTSERPFPLDRRYTYDEKGTGVHVYVLDTGIKTSHAQFGGPAGPGWRASGPHQNFVIGGGPADQDNHGHGTHVAGIIGGATYGIAKNVTLHSVRVLNDANIPVASDVAAGVQWVRTQKTTMPPMTPVVANLSLNFSDINPDLPTAPIKLTNVVADAISDGVTVVISAGNSGDPAANHWPGGKLSQLGGSIIVGAVNPQNDERWISSCFGSSVDLFAPGVDIISVMPNSATVVIPDCELGPVIAGSKTQRCSGTSMAAAHVSGVAALYLDSSNTTLDKRPAAVKNRIVNLVANISTTPGWAGITNGGAGSPNKLLHWGSLNDGYTDGDPHIKTVNGIHYDFQGAGEYVLLRDQDGMEIQTRQTAVATTHTLLNPYTGLASCVSINTAVAARVGTHRVTYQPNISGEPDSSGLELRVDGDLVELGPDGLDLLSGGRVVKTVTDGIEIHFPYETILTVTPGWWASQSKWYLNVDVLRTRSKQGLMGAIRPGSWLPALPDGTSLGPIPTALHERYIELYQKFGNAWRVTDKTSLFDYAPGDSTKTFSLQSWPPEKPPCVIAGTEPVKPTTPKRAEAACREITDKNRHANCVFDVTVTGNPGFANTYLLSERIRAGATTITLAGDQDTTQVGEWVTFTAIVAPSALTNTGVLAGAIQFSLDGSKVGEPVKLDSKGRATWETSRLKVGTHRVAASYIPSEGKAFLASTSLETIHTVKRCYCESESGHK